MTNFDFVKTLDIPTFIDNLSLTCGCPNRSNVACDEPSCYECWIKWLNAAHKDDGVAGGKV